jgi:uncharacterized membrane protein YesL
VSRTFGVGIVGAGTIGKVHAAELAGVEGVELVGVVEPSGEDGRELARSHGTEWDPDLEGLLARDDVDVVVLCTPSGLHADGAVAAARAGKHVISEKPMAITLDGVDRMIGACREAGVTLSVIFQYRFNRDALRMKRALDAGLFGRPVLCNALVHWYRDAERQMTARIYRVLEVFTDLVYLNLLWLVACLPVVTIAPSTPAMFGVVCGWIRGKDNPTMREFISQFRENFGRSLVVGLVWVVLGAVLAADFLLVRQMESFRRPLYVVFLAFAFLYVSATAYLFPVLVTYELGWKDVIKNSLLLSVARPLTTLQCLLTVAVTLFIVASLWITIFVASATTYAIYYLCDRSFKNVESLKGATSEPRAEEREP